MVVGWVGGWIVVEWLVDSCRMGWWVVVGRVDG